MADPLDIQGQLVTGEVAIDVPPGTIAQARDRALDAALAGPLNDAAENLGAVLAAPPHRFAQVLPGKDESGLTRFAVRGRAEGGRLVPERADKKVEKKYAATRDDKGSKKR